MSSSLNKNAKTNKRSRVTISGNDLAVWVRHRLNLISELMVHLPVVNLLLRFAPFVQRKRKVFGRFANNYRAIDLFSLKNFAVNCVIRVLARPLNVCKMSLNGTIWPGND